MTVSEITLVIVAGCAVLVSTTLIVLVIKIMTFVRRLAQRADGFVDEASAAARNVKDAAAAVVPAANQLGAAATSVAELAEHLRSATDVPDLVSHLGESLGGVVVSAVQIPAGKSRRQRAESTVQLSPPVGDSTDDARRSPEKVKQEEAVPAKATGRGVSSPVRWFRRRRGKETDTPDQDDQAASQSP